MLVPGKPEAGQPKPASVAERCCLDQPSVPTQEHLTVCTHNAAPVSPKRCKLFERRIEIGEGFTEVLVRRKLDLSNRKMYGRSIPIMI